MPNGVLDEGGLTPFAEQLTKEELADEKQMAAFSTTKEFKRLKEHLESRIAFYQSFLPDGRDVSGSVPTPEQWAIANGIVGEFKLIINTYLQAAEAVKNARR